MPPWFCLSVVNKSLFYFFGRVLLNSVLFLGEEFGGKIGDGVTVETPCMREDEGLERMLGDVP